MSFYVIRWSSLWIMTQSRSRSSWTTYAHMWRWCITWTLAQRCYKVSTIFLSFEPLLTSALVYKAVGIYLTSVARRAAEWPQGTINPSPLIIMACTLIQHNKAQSRVCIHIKGLGFVTNLGRCPSAGLIGILGDTSASDVDSLYRQYGEPHARRRNHFAVVPQSRSLCTRQRRSAC